MPSNKRWIHERRHEAYYKRAKKDGYLSRAAYKIKQIDEKYGIFDANEVGWVLDLCSAPGSWTQYVHDKNPTIEGIIGVDLQNVRSISDRVSFMRKDIMDEDFIEMVCKATGKTAPFFSVVLSDCAQKFTGARSVDLFRQHELSLRVVDVCKHLLLPGGNCILKSFQGLPEESRELEGALKGLFGSVFKTKPDSSQKGSPEFYFICKDKKATS
ncbi:MAG: RlmE family RNA methyltransferase [Candidatus Lokiarchaeota archaeon]|nr:RlmE family RNA methyltransferase [Candidatus Lokiarchaeota archaeon]